MSNQTTQSTNGASGTFTTLDNKVVTVVNGIIVSIVNNGNVVTGNNSGAIGD